MRIDDMTKTITKGSLEFRIEWLYDEDPDTSWIGEYRTKGPEEGYIDRKRGVLYGEAVEEPEDPCYECEKLEKCELYLHHFDNPFACKPRCIYEMKYQEWNDNYGLEILADELGSTWERNSHRFFVPHAGGEEPGSEHFAEYAIQNYDRITGLERGRWYFMGCAVTLSVDGMELGGTGVWGIESSCGDDYITQIEGEEISELIHDIPEYKEKLTEVLKALEEGDWDA